MNSQDDLQNNPVMADDDGPMEIELDASEIPDDLDSLGDAGLEVAPETHREPQDFNGNLASDLSDSIGSDCLGVMGLEIVEAIQEDERGRSDWEKTYTESLKFLGIKEEQRSLPWSNACGVVHPLLTEGITRFQSRASTKIFSQGGPVKISVDTEVNQQVQIEVVKAQRKINSYINNKMPEFRAETEKLLFAEAQIGVGFKKNYFSTRLGRVVSQFVKAENLILPYGCETIETCERVTEIVRKTSSEVKSLQRSGVYLDCNLVTGMERMGDVEEEKAELAGVEPSGTLLEGVKLYECHVELFIEEDEFANHDKTPSPYIVTIEETTQKILRIRRNWRQEDTLRRKRNVFVPYVYVPSDGPYGYGLVHLVGQLASAATKILRQLVDAGTLASVQAWFKSKDARMSSQGPLFPGELRDVDLEPEKLQQAFYPLPVKEPSQTLFQLLQLLIEKGESFSSMSDLEISASSQNAPVGTTLALIERQTEISNAVQSRLYDSLRIELGLIKEVLQEFQPDVYQDIFGALEQMTGQSCFLLPVGDPRSSTQSQRLILLQQVTQMAVQAPQIYDMAALHRSILTDMGIDDVDTLIPDQSKVEQQDPVTETMSLLTNKPVKAFPEQDHQAHIAIHKSVKSDPYLQQMLADNPRAMAIMAANEAHIAEHLAFQFQQDIQGRLGMQLPQGQQLAQMPPQAQAHIAQLVSGAVSQMVAEHTQQAKQQAAQQQAQDPALQLASREVDIKDKARQDKRDIAFAKLAHDTQHKNDRSRLEVVRIAAQADASQENNQTRLEIAGIKQDSDHTALAVDTFKHMNDVFSKATEGNQQP